MFYFEKSELHMSVFIQQNHTCLDIVIFHKYWYLIILQNHRKEGGIFRQSFCYERYNRANNMFIALGLFLSREKKHNPKFKSAL